MSLIPAKLTNSQVGWLPGWQLWLLLIAHGGAVTWMGDVDIGWDARGASAGSSCGDLPAALTALVNQVTAVKIKLAGISEQVRWVGPAAVAFHDHAATRYGTLAELVQELNGSAAVAHSLQCLVSERAL
jgi:hypothetical protein